MSQWLNERFEVGDSIEKFKNHPVPQHALNPMYCLGGLTFLSFLLQVMTGICLAFYYRPTPEAAYTSVQFIMQEVSFGTIIRSIHHYTANIMIILVFLHMFRVFYTGSFKKPRELNWLAGSVLLCLTLAFGFTGYLLSWDQLSYWASVVGTEIVGGIPLIGHPLMLFLRGGLNVTAYTLTRFYVLHTMVLPILAGIFMLGHFIMIRIQGISDEL